jgi:hypothetical protein
MAKQKGIINFEGKAGNLTFYKTRDGYAARSSAGINGSRIKTDPAYQRTRENGAEFGRAGKAGKLLRTAVRNLMINVADGRVTSRLTTEFLKVVKSDLVNDRGARLVNSGDLSLLIGFEFNVNAPLTQSIVAPFTTEIDRGNGTGTITIPPFIPKNMIQPPQGATHYRFLTGIVALNFGDETYVASLLVNPAQQLVNDEIGEVVLQQNLSEGFSELPIFLVMGIEFLQIINAKEYPLKSAANSALTIVGVSKVA